MKSIFSAVIVGLAFLLSGCVVRTYQVTRDRVDQDLNMGNRGYLTGQPKGMENKDRRMTRETHVVEIELGSSAKVRKSKNKKAAKEVVASEDLQAGNQGFVNEEDTSMQSVSVPTEKYQQYTVQKGDTLQKISQKFFGTTKKWMKIYNANSSQLKAPNKIYPGQVINIPETGMKEPQENLK